MKTLTLTLIAAGLANVAVAQFGTLPACATVCLQNFESGGDTIAGCNRLDFKCICSNGGFLDGIACCLISGCTQAEQDAAVTYANNFCRPQGITDLPTAVSCSTTAPGASSSSSSKGKSTEATTTSSPVTTAGGATVSSTPPSGTPESTSASVTPPASGTTGAGSSPSSSSPTSTNAASQNMAVMGAGLVGGLAAVAAFL